MTTPTYLQDPLWRRLRQATFVQPRDATFCGSLALQRQPLKEALMEPKLIAVSTGPVAWWSWRIITRSGEPS
jgi:hypothetical protein